MTTPRVRSQRGRNAGQPPEAFHLPRTGREKSEDVRATLAAKGLDPIATMAALIQDEDTPVATKARLLEVLAPFVAPKQRAESEAMEELRRRMETQISFVIMGEVEDASAQDWEARNAHWREWLAKRDIGTPREPVVGTPAGTVQ